MDEKKKKSLSFEIKEISESERSFVAVGSTEDIDRDNDRIMSAGWNFDDFNKNPVIPWSHRYSEPPVARAEEVWVEKNKLYFRPKFATRDEYPHADSIYRLYKGGFLNAFSVGFMPKRYEIVEREGGGKGMDFLEQDLWEISACTVPANPNALVAAKSEGVIDADEYATITGITSGMEAFLERLTAQMTGHLEKNTTVDPNVGTLLERMLGKLDEITSGLNALWKMAPLPEENPPTLITPENLAESLKTAIDAKLATVENAVEGRIKYHMGIVE